jgi:vacuolar-type H+-ATPase subunit H
VLIENPKPVIVDNQKIEEINEKVETFEEMINDFKETHDKILEDVDDIKKKDLAKATEKNLAFYFEKLANGLQKELGERPPYNP